MNTNTQDDGLTEQQPLDGPIADVLTKEFAGYHLGDIELVPYSPSRKVAAQTMGMKYPHIGDDGIAAIDAMRPYKGALLDTIIVLWLCTLPDSAEGKAWTPSRAIRNAELALDAAMEWANDLKLNDMSIEGKFGEGYGLFMAIVSNVAAATFYAQMADEVPAPGGNEGKT